MNNQSYFGQKGTYITSKEIGKGGEGSVYELSSHSSLVLKVYSESITKENIQKLKLMASLYNIHLDKYTAWVNDVITDTNGNVCGFVMKKLVNYIPLHMLFSPMDRKKLFPEKGYNFLVHVARNLATAFKSCHDLNLVIGDINEGNILVNAQGVVAFIDCDSFQIKEGHTYHFCEVGVPRYTPPELLEKLTFNNIIRTTNTDCFSMAILIFQLLFLGRHPFAGKNNSNEDISEETAIKNHWFAYSTRTRFNKLSPPIDSFSIQNISSELIDLFHNSFEKIENRPLPINYIKELDIFLNEMIVCKQSKIHLYPSKLQECPWCIFQNERNILYFLDDSYLQKIPSLIDIENFINGFKIEKINYSKLDFPVASSVSITSLPIDKKYFNFKWYHRLVLALPVILGMCLFFISGWLLAAGIIISIAISNALPWNKKINEELKKRSSEFKEKKAKLEFALKEFNTPTELRNYERLSLEIENLISRFKNLPNELLAKRKSVEEKIYTEQLHIFLSTFEIRNHAIPSFGSARKLSLYVAGIRNASEISKLNKIKVQGIGSRFEQILFSWQRQVSSKFIYHPDYNLLNRQYSLITIEIEQTKKHLENEIKKVYQSLHYLKTDITTKQKQLKKHIEFLTVSYFQAESNFQEFKKFVA